MNNEIYSFKDMDWFMGVDNNYNVTIFPLVYNQSKTKIKNLLDDSVYLFNSECFSNILKSYNLKPITNSIATSNNLGISVVSSIPGFTVFKDAVYSPLDSITIDAINKQRLITPPLFTPYSLLDYYYEHIYNKQYDKSKIVKISKQVSKVLSKEYKKENSKQQDNEIEQ